MNVRFAVVVLALCAGCASTRSNRFPTDEKLQEVAARPAKAVDFGPAVQRPSEWTLTGPFPEQVGVTPHPQQSAWDTTFLSSLSAAAPRLIPTGNLACAAREGALYSLKTSATPDTDLLAFITARCGAAVAGTTFLVLRGESSPDQPEAEFAAESRDELDQMVGSVAQWQQVDAVGFAMVRDGSKVALAVVAGISRAQVEPFAVAGDGKGVFEVKGALAGAAETVFGRINRGRFGVANCVSDPAVKPPRFALRCEGDPADGSAWLEVGSRQPGRVLGDRVFRALVSPAGQVADTFRRETFAPVPSAELPRPQRFAALVNQARATAGLRPLQFEPEQSATAERVAPHYFDALSSQDPERIRDTIALGMMAGWNVQGGTIQYGNFTSDWIDARQDLDVLVSSMVLYPSGRDALLDPKATRLAVGAVEASEASAIALLASTYAMVERRPAQEEAALVIEQINKARAARGLEPAVWVAAPGNAGQEAIEICESRQSPEDGTRHLLEAAVEAAQAPMRGWTLHTWALDELNLPSEIVMTPRLAVVVAVGGYRAPGDPWGGYAVMLVLPELKSIQPNLRVDAPSKASSGGPRRAR